MFVAEGHFCKSFKKLSGKKYNKKWYSNIERKLEKLEFCLTKVQVKEFEIEEGNKNPKYELRRHRRKEREKSYG